MTPTAEAAQPSAAPPNSGPIDLETGFPHWYTDVSGLQLDMCLGGAEPDLCLDTIPNPGERPAVPDNWTAEGEAFWWAAEAAIPLPGVPDDEGEPQEGEALLVLAKEATFGGTEAIVQGQQIAFGRLRIRARELTPFATYTFLHPYGTRQLEADDRGRITFTQDIGCGAAPCDFTRPLSSPVTGGYLRSTAPPAGHIGDPGNETTVTGGPVRNFFRIEGEGLGAGLQTDLFTVQGRIWQPRDTPTLALDSRFNLVNFGRQLAEPPLEAAAVLTNVGAPALSIGDLEIDDDASGAFSIVSDTCASPLATEATCAVNLAFDGAGLDPGTYTATLVVSSDDPVGDQTIPLQAIVGPSARTQGPIDPETGFPLWYQDENGLKLDLCLDDGANCLAVLPNLTAPPHVPNNFDPAGEAFWWAAEADLSDELGTSRAILVLALEAAFMNEDPIAGDQVAFGRLRIRFRDLTPNAEYTVRHPYGTETMIADADGEINETTDIGCGVVPCDFSLALDAIPWPFLTAVAPAPPAGTIGNPGGEQTVTGSPVGQNLFSIEGPGIDGVQSTDVFSVQGRVWAIPDEPVLAIDGNFNEVAFDLQTLNNAEQTLTFTNAGSQPLTDLTYAIAASPLFGNNTADFSVVPGGTCGATLAPDTTCTVNIRFNAQSRGVKVAALRVTSNDPGAPHFIKVSGTALDPTLPEQPVQDVIPAACTGGVPLSGDWNNDGVDTWGRYQNGRVCLSNGAGTPTIQFTYGSAGDVPVVGDWNNNNTDTIGIRRGATWHLRNSNTAGPGELVFNFGTASDRPVVGDWNGNGQDTVGIRRGAQWHLRNSNTAGAGQVVFNYGVASDVPVVGDWNDNDQDTVGIRRGAQWHLRNTNTGGAASVTPFNYGIASDRPITGDWSGNGQDTVGVVRGSTWHLRNTNNGGAANTSFDF